MKKTIEDTFAELVRDLEPAPSCSQSREQCFGISGMGIALIERRHFNPHSAHITAHETEIRKLETEKMAFAARQAKALELPELLRR